MRTTGQNAIKLLAGGRIVWRRGRREEDGSEWSEGERREREESEAAEDSGEERSQKERTGATSLSPHNLSPTCTSTVSFYKDVHLLTRPIPLFRIPCLQLTHKIGRGSDAWLRLSGRSHTRVSNVWKSQHIWSLTTVVPAPLSLSCIQFSGLVILSS